MQVDGIVCKTSTYKSKCRTACSFDKVSAVGGKVDPLADFDWNLGFNRDKQLCQLLCYFEMHISNQCPSSVGNTVIIVVMQVQPMDSVIETVPGQESIFFCISHSLGAKPAKVENSTLSFGQNSRKENGEVPSRCCIRHTNHSGNSNVVINSTSLFVYQYFAICMYQTAA